jgi:hypothetical protein
MPTDPTALLSGIRTAVGAAAWTAPNLSGKVMGLDPAANPQAAFLGRLFGVRDVAMGVGTSMARGEARRSWLALGVLVDGMDAVAAALAGRNGTLPRHAAVMSGAIAVVAAGLGVAALAQADD